MLRFDFRADLDHIDLLKALPLSTRAVVLAELAAPVGVLTLLGWILAAAVGVFSDVSPVMVLLGALAVFPIALTLIALENFTFLVLPSRLYGPGQAAMQFSGRRIVILLSRMVLVTIGAFGVTFTGGLAWLLTKSLPVTYAAAWVTLLALGLLVCTAVGWAFQRFDVSRDMPG
jgi:hypothetical protein